MYVLRGVETGDAETDVEMERWRETALDMGREVDTRRKRDSEKVQRERLGEGREMDNYGDTWI